MYKCSAKLQGVSKGALLGNNIIPIPHKWGLNLKFKAFPYQLYSVSEMFHQEYIKLNSGIFIDGIGTGKTVTIYLTIVLNYYYTINLDKVATN